MPGLTRHYYNNHYWPDKIETCSDEDILSWLENHICMIPIAIGLFKSFGVSINPMIASAAMMLSSLCMVFNSLRLRRIK